MKYKKAIEKIEGLQLADVPEYARNNYWMYCLQIDKDKYPLDRESLMQKLIKNNIQTRPVWYPNHLQKPYLEYENYKIENTLKLVEKTLNLPCSVNIVDEEINHIVEQLKNG